MMRESVQSQPLSCPDRAEAGSVQATIPAAASLEHWHPPTSLDRGAVLDWLQSHVPEPRLRHILRVEAMAIALAQHHHLDVERAGQAGLLHDLAKFFKPQRLLQMAEAEGLDLDPVEQANPHLLHAEVGAIVARDEFDIHDQEVLWAIRNHTLGRPGMSPLSCVVFLADSLEPGRGDTPALENLRSVSLCNLYQGVWYTCEETMQSLITSQRLIHPRVVLTRNWAMRQVSAHHTSVV